MISGTNFESEWGQLFPIRLTMIIRFGGHLTMKKRNQLAFANEKGSHLSTGDYFTTRRRSIGVGLCRALPAPYQSRPVHLNSPKLHLRPPKFFSLLRFPHASPPPPL